MRRIIPKVLVDFTIAQFMKFALYFVVWYIGGLLVLKKNIKVNYTRKINHFSLLFIPFLLDLVLKKTNNSGGNESIEEGILFSALGLGLGLLYLLLFLKPIRSRIKILDTAFLSIDRPEDRPFTLLWITTQTAANFLVMIPFSTYLMIIDRMDLVFIIMLINGFGDGLAEPVGIRFGKHKYKTYALFTKKKYERSLEGSTCVFIASIIVISIHFTSFSSIQFIAALITIPMFSIGAWPAEEAIHFTICGKTAKKSTSTASISRI